MVKEKKESFGNIKSYLEWSDKGKSGIARYIWGTFLIFIAFFILAGLGSFPLTLIDPEYKKSIIESNLALLLAFIIPFVLIPLITKWVNKRPWWSVAMPKLAIEKWNLMMGFIISTLVGLVAFLVCSVFGVLEVEYAGFDWGKLLPLAVIGLVGIFIQASSEEMLFRGYITQFTRKITKNPIIFLTIPALLFAFPHIANIASLGGGVLVMVPYLISGLLYGWAAYRTGSLWMSVGLHLSNNLSGVLLVGTKGDALQTVAPFITEDATLAKATIIIFAQTVVTILILLPMIRKREAFAKRNPA